MLPQALHSYFSPFFALPFCESTLTFSAASNGKWKMLSFSETKVFRQQWPERETITCQPCTAPIIIKLYFLSMLSLITYEPFEYETIRLNLNFVPQPSCVRAGAFHPHKGPKAFTCVEHWKKNLFCIGRVAKLFFAVCTMRKKFARGKLQIRAGISILNVAVMLFREIVAD